MILAFAAGCDGASREAACPDPAGDAGDRAPRFAAAASSVRVGTTTLAASARTTSHLRAVLRREPLPELHVVVDEQGACRRLEAAVFHCAPACPADALCTAQDTCTTIGLPRSAGTLSITVDGETTTLEPDAILHYEAERRTLDGCPPIEVSAAGADVPPFAVAEALVPPIEIVDLAGLGYFAGEGLTVRWRPADPGARVRITFRADSAAHGAVYPSILECDARDDAGEIAVPAAMMDAHIARFGCGNCPYTSVTRYRRGATWAGDAEVELVTEDERLLFLYPGGIELPSAMR